MFINFFIHYLSSFISVVPVTLLYLLCANNLEGQAAERFSFPFPLTLAIFGFYKTILMTQGCSFENT